MSHQFIKLTSNATIKEALEKFLEMKQDIACIFQHNKFIGIITKNSVFRLLLKCNHIDHTIEPAIITNPFTFQHDESVEKAKEKLKMNKMAHSVVINDQGEIIGIVSRADIVTALIAETDHLARKLKLLMNALTSGVISIDLDRKVTDINKAALSFVGEQNCMQVIGKKIHEIVPDIEKALLKAIKNKEAVEMTRIKLKEKPLLCSIIPINDWKKMIGSIIVLDDISKFERVSKDIEKVRLSNTSEYFSHMISCSSIMQDLKEEAYIAAKGFSSILITGQSGTGKELLANGIHNASGRQGAFIKVNCAAIPESLMESEFFGYEDGAFTGAKKGGKPGKFELAKGGTLFLDEIGEMSLSLQVKLLRVLQEKEYEKVGGIKTYRADVRIIAATNKDLLQLIRQGKFREDLYFRLNVIHLEIPPLHRRLEDIPLLCTHFIHKFQRYNPKGVIGLTSKAIEMLQEYSWPGNVRELENILERAYQYCNDHLIDDNYLKLRNEHVVDKYQTVNHSISKKPHLQSIEREVIIEALINTKGNKSQAAQTLGISRSNLYEKIKKYQIQLRFS